ncbi:hypothetical protein GW17_00035314 [Ensete ventricosum]|nr:hypothetical protein GW17_00035314 [Ensete ventricosum]
MQLLDWFHMINFVVFIFIGFFFVDRAPWLCILICFSNRQGRFLLSLNSQSPAINVVSRRLFSMLFVSIYDLRMSDPIRVKDHIILSRVGEEKRSRLLTGSSSEPQQWLRQQRAAIAESSDNGI